MHELSEIFADKKVLGKGKTHFIKWNDSMLIYYNKAKKLSLLDYYFC